MIIDATAYYDQKRRFLEVSYESESAVVMKAKFNGIDVDCHFETLTGDIEDSE